MKFFSLNNIHFNWFKYIFIEQDLKEQHVSPIVSNSASSNLWFIFQISIGTIQGLSIQITVFSTAIILAALNCYRNLRWFGDVLWYISHFVRQQVLVIFGHSVRYIEGNLNVITVSNVIQIWTAVLTSGIIYECFFLLLNKA